MRSAALLSWTSAVMRKITNSSRMELMAMEALKTRSFMIYTSSKTGLGDRDKVKSYTSVLPKRRTVGKKITLRKRAT